MSTWSPAARQELDRYCESLRSNLKDSGADPTEVIDDIKRHVEEEIVSCQLNTVTDREVKEILSKFGMPAAEKRPVSVQDPSQLPDEGHPKKFPGTFCLFFGIGLPVATLLIELLTHMCATSFFNPIPSWFHVVLVALVPTANLLIFVGMRDNRQDWRNGLGWLSGISMGISLCYAIVFLPLFIPGVFAILAFGWGLLPLSPLIVFITGFVFRQRLKSWLPGQSLPHLGKGMALGALLALFVQLPIFVTEIGLTMAKSDRPETRERGVRWLRSLGDEEQILRLCYGRPNWARDLNWVVWNQSAVNEVQAQSIYYRVTGKPFNSSPPPAMFSLHGNFATIEQNVSWDADQGGTEVAGRVRGLSIQRSGMDGVIEAESGTSYIEWTLEFGNQSSRQQEARAQIRLPHGGVISRLTLWVNGEEREAAFAAKSQVREAYERVVKARMDPVLITTTGPDTILMQCFPVPANGGSMKVRFGMTSPIQYTRSGEGRVVWPVFLERNFNVPEGFTHTMWMESPSPLTSNVEGLVAEKTSNQWHGLRGRVSEQKLAKLNAGLRVKAMPGSTWSEDPRQGEGWGIHQELRKKAGTVPGRIAVVLDGSRGMETYAASVASVWKDVFAARHTMLFLARDDGLKIPDGTQIPVLQKMAKSGNRVGGENNLKALLQAWEWASNGTGPATILWIHGPQPIDFEEIMELRQKLERRPDGPLLWDFQVVAGPNRVSMQMEGIHSYRAAARIDTVEADLEQWISEVGGEKIAWHREPMHQSKKPAGMRAGSMHVVRLWAADDVRRLLRDRDISKAVTMASTYQLVTACTGAVVLENQAQYTQAGLNPVDAKSTPSVPEPGTWALLAVAAVVLCLKKPNFFLNGRKKLG